MTFHRLYRDKQQRTVFAVVSGPGREPDETQVVVWRWAAGSSQAEMVWVESVPKGDDEIAVLAGIKKAKALADESTIRRRAERKNDADIETLKR